MFYKEFILHVPRAVRLSVWWQQETAKQKLWTAIKVRAQKTFCEGALTSFDRKQMT